MTMMQQPSIADLANSVAASGFRTRSAFVEDEPVLPLAKRVQYFEEEYRAPLALVEDVSKTPRFYQANTTNELADALIENHKRIAIVGPTGCGKTLIGKLVCLSIRVRQAMGLSEDVVYGRKKLRVLYIANKHRLIRQAQEEYAENSTIELIPQSAMSRIPDDVLEKGWDVCVIDECHHEAMNSIQKLLDSITNRPIIGLTADDKRGDGVLIKFSKVIVSISEYEAAMRGFIEKAGINTILDTGPRNKVKLAMDIISRYHRHMGNTIVFFRTEAEVNKAYTLMRRMGLSVGKLGSKNNEADMDRQLERLSAGEIQFLVNCQKIGEGVDTPNVTDVVLAINFKSHAQKKQFIGRSIRPDSPCAVWDFMNPLKRSIESKAVVGATKYERLIYCHKGEWFEKLYTGEDDTWGQMAELRTRPEGSYPSINPDKVKSAKGEKASQEPSAAEQMAMAFNTANHRAAA